MNAPVKIVPSCARCVCFAVDENATNIGGEKQGQCHRFPPQVVSVTHKTLQGIAMVPGAMFPQVGESWWCAEFRPKPDSAPKAH